MARLRRKKSKRVNSTAQPVTLRTVKTLPKQGKLAIDDIRQAVVKASSSMQAL